MSRQINYFVIELDAKTHRMSVRNFYFELIFKEEEKGKEEEK